MLVARDAVTFCGHEMIRATHRSTFEITKEDFVGPKGDCIIGIRSNKACADLNPFLRKTLKNDNSRITLTLIAGGHLYKVMAFGSSELTLEDNHSLVVRKSSFICPRTLAIKANSSAKDFSRTLISFLKIGDSRATMIMEATILR